MSPTGRFVSLLVLFHAAGVSSADEGDAVDPSVATSALAWAKGFSGGADIMSSKGEDGATPGHMCFFSNMAACMEAEAEVDPEDNERALVATLKGSGGLSGALGDLGGCEAFPSGGGVATESVDDKTVRASFFKDLVGTACSASIVASMNASMVFDFKLSDFEALSSGECAVASVAGGSAGGCFRLFASILPGGALKDSSSHMLPSRMCACLSAVVVAMVMGAFR